ncbi:hypothetical protein, partial [Neisseria meningitidis]|uniref:hypothetical protein n=1 Tax=Neisseria meningitidis TaxID=487 RepID=UPI0011815CB4
MKIKTVLFTLLTGVITFFSAEVFAQTTQVEQDSVKLRIAQDSIKAKADGDRLRLVNAADLRRSTESESKIAKANAKKADQIEDDASNAAREAKQASKMEAKAQKNRIKADKQAKKA